MSVSSGVQKEGWKDEQGILEVSGTILYDTMTGCNCNMTNAIVKTYKTQ